VTVVDTNVIAYLFLPSEYTAHAEALLVRDPEWAAPVLWRSEFRNVLAGYMRRNRLQSEAEDLLAGNEYNVDSARVLELVRDSDCSAYDCEFVAVAMHLGVKLVTTDAKLVKAFPRQVIALSPG
jgi:predicted nucleic acid-binding protein